VIDEILRAMQAITDAAEGRALTAEEADRYEALERDLKAAQRSDEIRARNSAYNTPVNGAPALIAGGRKPETANAGFMAYLRTGRPNADLQNAQSEGIPSEGGYLVPDEFRTKLVERLKAFGGLGAVVDRYTTGNGRPVEWPTVDDTANVGEIVQEGNTFSSGADVVFGSNSLTSYSYVAGGGSSTPLRISYELAQDQAFDLEALLTRLLGKRIYRIQATHWVSGSGVQQPLGLLTGTTPVGSAANTGITFEDLVNYIHAVDPEYRGNARWAMNDLSLAKLEVIKDGSGSYIWRGRDANMAIGLNEATLLGYPVTIDQGFPTLVANSGTVKWGAFGDLQQGYVIRDIKDATILVNPYTRMANRQIEYTMWARADGTQQDTNAYITMTAHV
jgi:HK97 family phage major capsid protein